MTNQDRATQALLEYQAHRGKPASEIEALMAEYFMSEELRQYEQVMRCVTREMEDSNVNL